MNPVVHFEMSYEDRQRMADFYSKAFGWKTQMLGEEMGNYVLAQSAESNEQGHPKNPGCINGGFYPRQPGLPGQEPSFVIGVNDIQSAMQAVRDAGGEILGEPMEIPGYGLYVPFHDTEGNRLSMMAPIMAQGNQG